jgi:hypothetical protein
MFVRLKDAVSGEEQMEWSRNLMYFKHLRSGRLVTNYRTLFSAVNSCKLGPVNASDRSFSSRFITDRMQQLSHSPHVKERGHCHSEPHAVQVHKRDCFHMTH